MTLKWPFVCGCATRACREC